MEEEVFVNHAEKSTHLSSDQKIKKKKIGLSNFHLFKNVLEKHTTIYPTTKTIYMNNCKKCGRKLIKESRNLGDFCSEECFWGYEDLRVDAVEVVGKADSQSSASDEMYFGMIKKKIKENKIFIISSKTLEQYTSLKAFDNFMVENKFMLVKHDEQLSVIKRSILA